MFVRVDNRIYTTVFDMSLLTKEEKRQVLDILKNHYNEDAMSLREGNGTGRITTVVSVNENTLRQRIGRGSSYETLEAFVDACHLEANEESQIFRHWNIYEGRERQSVSGKNYVELRSDRHLEEASKSMLDALPKNYANTVKNTIKSSGPLRRENDFSYVILVQMLFPLSEVDAMLNIVRRIDGYCIFGRQYRETLVWSYDDYVIKTRSILKGYDVKSTTISEKEEESQRCENPIYLAAASMKTILGNRLMSREYITKETKFISFNLFILCDSTEALQRNTGKVIVEESIKRKPLFLTVNPLACFLQDWDKYIDYTKGRSRSEIKGIARDLTTPDNDLIILRRKSISAPRTLSKLAFDTYAKTSFTSDTVLAFLKAQFKEVSSDTHELTGKNINMFVEFDGRLNTSYYTSLLAGSRNNNFSDNLKRNDFRVNLSLLAHSLRNKSMTIERLLTEVREKHALINRNINSKELTLIPEDILLYEKAIMLTAYFEKLFDTYFAHPNLNTGNWLFKQRYLSNNLSTNVTQENLREISMTSGWSVYAKYTTYILEAIYRLLISEEEEKVVQIIKQSRFVPDYEDQIRRHIQSFGVDRIIDRTLEETKSISKATGRHPDFYRYNFSTQVETKCSIFLNNINTLRALVKTNPEELLKLVMRLLILESIQYYLTFTKVYDHMRGCDLISDPNECKKYLLGKIEEEVSYYIGSIKNKL